jgi:hypothetical protein
VQGNDHLAYGSWSRLPPDGYELLPNTFLVWDQYDADAIEAWGGTVHQAVVGGHPGQALWESGAFGSPEDLVRTLQSASRGATRSVLIALGGDESLDELRLLLELIKAAPTTWHWWVRCHPLRDERTAISDLLVALGIDNAEVALATDSPLLALLKVSDVTLSRFSTVVRDSARCGVPSVLIDKLGAELFPAEVASGVASLADAADHSGVVDMLASASFPAVVHEARKNAGLQWVRDVAGTSR